MTAVARRHHLADLAESLTLLMAEGNARHAEELVRAAIARGASGADLHAEVIAPAMVGIGELWARGLVSVGEEHLASAICDDLLDVVSVSLMLEAPRTRGRLLLACVEGEAHALGLRMAADVLQGAGYDVLSLGADTPRQAVVHMASAHRVDAVGLSVVLPEHASAAIAVTELLREGEIPVLVGGAAAPRALEGRDGVAVVRDVRETLPALRALVPARRLAVV